MDTSAPTAGAAPMEAAAEAQPPMERLSEAVAKNPLDFDSWTQLLALVESEAETPPETVAATYDRFLAEFPLCFGYWNKYAMYEFSLGTRTAADGAAPAVSPADASQRARAVYERGVAAVRHSVDMWVKYCEFLVQTAHAPLEDCRSALEAAVAACGSDPMAGTLWDLYIQLETVNNEMLRLNEVFKRIMHQPLNNLDEFWEKYNQFVLAQQLNVLATSDELKALAAGDDLMDEGLLRVKIVNAVEQVKNRALESVYRRQTFEAAIDRSYFHVTPVSDAALKNWHSYLDYEEVAGDQARCETLYERCLVACANYEEMWTRYAVWKEKAVGFDAAKEVFDRAVTIFLKYRASIYLEYAAFLEAHDKLADAEAMFMKVIKDVAPTLAEAYLRYCNFERRRRNVDAAKAWYERAMEAVHDQSGALAYVAVAFASFLHRSLGDVAGARAVYERAVVAAGDSLLLWMNYITFETQASSGNNATEDFPSRVVALYERAVSESSTLSNNEKNDVWFQYAEFVELYGDSIVSVRQIYERELTWKRKNSVPRDRKVRVVSWNSGSSNEGYDDSVDVGTKRLRVSEDDTATSASATPVAATSSTAEAQANAYAQYYQGQGYQGYGAQGYSQADPTAMAQSTAYSQAYAQQYAGYYQQQQQQQQQQ